MANSSSLLSLLNQLSTTNDPAEQSGIIAEAAIDRLPPVFAQVARRCIILRWFDRTIIQALLPDDTAQSEEASTADNIHQVLVALPFVEKLAWGLTYHDQTRKGLLIRHETVQPTILKEAAAIAAPAYLQHHNQALAEIEALFCYVVAGKQREASELLDRLLLQAGSRRDWNRILILFQTQEQAEALQFVTKIERTSFHKIIHGLACYARGDQSTPLETHIQNFASLSQGEVTDTIRDNMLDLFGYSLADKLANSKTIITEADFSDTLALFLQSSQKLTEILPLISDYGALFYAARRYISYHSFEQAKEAEELVQAIADHTGNSEHRAFVHWCQGILYRSRHPQQSLDHAVQAVGYFQSTGQTEYEGRILIGCAYQRSLMGDLAQAKADLLRAIECLASLPDYPDWPAVYINLANTLIMQGDFTGAIANAKQADEEAQRLSALMPEDELPVYHSMRAQALNNQALAILFQGRLSEAESLFEAALEQALLGDSPEDAGRAELSLVRIATEKGELFSALRRLHSAVNHLSAAEVELELATAAIEEANLYEKLVMPERALEAATRAAQAFVKAGIPAESVEAYLIGVRLALARGINSKALAFLAEAEKYLDKAPPLHRARWQGYRAHPQLQNSDEEKRQALDSAQEAQSQLQHLEAVSEALEIGLITAELSSELNLPDAKQRLGQIAESAQQHELHSIEQAACEKLAALQQDDSAVRTWQRAARVAADIRGQMPVEELKARLLTGQASLYAHLIDAQLKRNQPREAMASLLEAKGSIWLELAAPAHAVELSADRLHAKAQVDFWRQEKLNALTPEHRAYSESKIEEAEKELVEASRHQARLRQPLPIPTVEEIQAALPPQACLLEYLVGTTHIWCCVIHPGEDVQWNRLCKRQEVKNALSKLAGITRTLQQPRTLEDRHRLTQGYQTQTVSLLKKLHDHLLAPLVRYWSGDSLLVIVPDGLLYDIPWAALHDGDAYLSEQHVTTLIPSSVLVTKEASQLPFTGLASQAVPHILGYVGEPPLSFLGAELQAIQATLPNAIIHNPASRQDLQSVVAPQILHISAHCYSNPGSPLLSSLELLDGEFYLDDILSLHLHNTQLVTLSACETGKIPAEGGALLALAGAFLCTGARMTLSSLWSVDDEATQVLMGYFYRQLHTGTTPAEALQHAQRETRQAGYMHPFYWAAFQPLGRTLS